MPEQWFLLRDDKKTPHTLAELREMAASGQLLPTDLIQQAGTTQWLVPAQVEGIFDWYYTAAGQQIGPVSWPALRQLAEQRKLGAVDLVWHAGMAEWTEAGKVEGLLPKAPVVRMPPPLPKSVTPPVLPDPAQASKVTGEIKYAGQGGSSRIPRTLHIELDGVKIGEGTLESGLHIRFETTVGQHTLKIDMLLPRPTFTEVMRGETPPLRVELTARTPFVLHSPGHYIITLNHPKKKLTAIFGNPDHLLPSELDIKKA